jgi:hypothetical protein
LAAIAIDDDPAIDVRGLCSMSRRTSLTRGANLRW